MSSTLPPALRCPEPVIAVSTCKREGNYLPATLASLERTGALDFERFVLVDKDEDEPFDVGAAATNWPVVDYKRSFPTVRNNLWNAFRMAVQLGSPRLLFFEDDILLCKNAVRRMATVEIPDTAAFMTFHDVKEHEPGTKPGIYLSDDAHGKEGTGFWGSQALAIPRRTLEYLVTCDPFSVWKSSLPRHGDRVLEHFVSKSKWPRFAVHMPCLVRHVGEVSVAHPGKSLSVRTTTNWPGLDYDAAG